MPEIKNTRMIESHNKVANLAYKHVTSFLGQGPDGTQAPQKDERKEYKSYVKKIPMLIYTNGLAATWAYMSEKGRSYEKIMKQIIEYLVATGQIDVQTDHKKFLSVLTESGTMNYRSYSMSIQNYLLWLKRYTSALIKDNHGS